MAGGEASDVLGDRLFCASMPLSRSSGSAWELRDRARAVGASRRKPGAPANRLTGAGTARSSASAIRSRRCSARSSREIPCIERVKQCRAAARRGFETERFGHHLLEEIARGDRLHLASAGASPAATARAWRSICQPATATAHIVQNGTLPARRSSSEASARIHMPIAAQVCAQASPVRAPRRPHRPRSRAISAASTPPSSSAKLAADQIGGLDAVGALVDRRDARIAASAGPRRSPRYSPCRHGPARRGWSLPCPHRCPTP